MLKVSIGHLLYDLQQTVCTLLGECQILDLLGSLNQDVDGLWDTVGAAADELLHGLLCLHGDEVLLKDGLH